MKAKIISLLLVAVLILSVCAACSKKESEQQPQLSEEESTALEDAQKALSAYLKNTVGGEGSVVIKDKLKFVVEKAGKLYAFTWEMGKMKSNGEIEKADNIKDYELVKDKDLLKEVPNNVKVYIPAK
ncbi:MAG TPA: hypothetical protein GXZ61_04555 [Clostridiales bacterium]|jgi:hypothetical protein|nr:hypothetical protein [Clostridiales bacterium]